MGAISNDIINRAREGDIGAFESIYNDTSGFVYGLAYRIMGSREDAQEVTQDVFLKIYKNLKKFRFQSSFKTWVYRIAVNTAINYSKKKAKELRRMVKYEDTIKFETESGSTEERIDKEGSEELIKALLDMLNLEQKACVILRSIEGLSYKEIAETLNININTVRSRLKRAREKLLTYKRSDGQWIAKR